MEHSGQERAEPRVVAVVVAYNRRELLGQTLDALAAQARPCDAVVVVDNASTDGSGAVAAAHLSAPDVVSLTRNTGGAGGFAAGIAHALQSHRADLVWIMDDDTVPTPTALEELLRARAAYPGEPALLASRVVWKDGRDHPMNTPRPRPGAGAAGRARAAAAGAVQVRSASFVSLLLDARAVRAVGLPQAAYFIWNDDFEYTARVLRRRTGLYVPSSVVRHLTRTFGATDADPGDRFYFEVRNKVWLFARSTALGPLDTLLYGGSSLVRWARTAARSRERGRLLRAGWRGLRDGVATSPQATSALLADQGAVTDEVREIERGARRG
ncbi:glycosyltransferase [Georgenia thermotolerans]|uniref:glycosyltransferase n=1 Tax=Georgenia thermotolerans TaxID=527326 RepID=UPI001D014EE7|nr:glycosyltransferase [Georgenia thermotolerans]